MGWAQTSGLSGPTRKFFIGEGYVVGYQLVEFIGWLCGGVGSLPVGSTVNGCDLALDCMDLGLQSVGDLG